MARANRRKRRAPKRKKKSGGWLFSDPARRNRLVLLALTLGGALTILGGAGAGIHLLEQSVLAGDRLQLPAVFRLVDAPPGLEEEIRESLAGLEALPWTDPALCRRIGGALEANPWVRRVVRVRKQGDRTVTIECQYRAPTVLVQAGAAFYLVADDQVRLPGAYSYDPQMMVVQGVALPPPVPGQRWSGGDLEAGLALVRILEREPFARQVTGVLVHNYDGRENDREPHLALATDSPGGRIVWGSAPGEELEENSAAQKIAILLDNYRRFGRIDANRRIIDVSLHPDRFATPA